MARRLILMRHARAASASTSGDDADRPLTEAGRADARLIGKALAEADIAPGRALVSAALRTRQTWSALQDLFPTAVGQFNDGLYNADSARLLELAQDLADEPDEETVIIIGHNPGVHMAVLELLSRGGAGASTIASLERNFAPATAVAFAVDAGGRMQYDGMFTSRDLGGGAGE